MVKSKPEKTIRVSNVQIAIWANETDKGIRHSITLSKSYKDGDTWKTSTSFNAVDLLKIQIGINKVFEYLYIKSSGDDVPF